MDQGFETLQRVESEWPLPSPNGKMYYDDFYERMHRVSINHVGIARRFDSTRRFDEGYTRAEFGSRNVLRNLVFSCIKRVDM